MTIQGLNIPENLQDNFFIKSVNEQYLAKGYVSKKQFETLKDVIGVEEELPEIECKEYQIFSRKFYRLDYHGDPLCDYRTSILTDDTTIDLNSKILNSSASQHGVIEYEPEYEITGKCLIPVNTKSPKLFFSYLYEFNLILDKIKRNKFRTVKNKNIAIRAIKELIQAEGFVDSKLIEQASGKKYW